MYIVLTNPKEKYLFCKPIYVERLYFLFLFFFSFLFCHRIYLIRSNMEYYIYFILINFFFLSIGTMLYCFSKFLCFILGIKNHQLTLLVRLDQRRGKGSRVNFARNYAISNLPPPKKKQKTHLI